MVKRKSQTLEDFDGQVITDYFQTFVDKKKINGFEYFATKSGTEWIEYKWNTQIRKRWKYECIIIVYTNNKKYFSPHVKTSSRFCKINVHQSQKLSQIIKIVCTCFEQVLRGAEAEKLVMNIINNDLVLPDRVCAHCFPASSKDDINGVDLNMYLRVTPRSDVVKLPLQVKRTRFNSRKMLRFQNILKFKLNTSNVYIVAVDNNVDEIKKQLFQIVMENIQGHNTSAV